MKLSIKNRIYFSFTLLVTLFVVNGIITVKVLNNNIKESEYFTEVIEPSLRSLDDLGKMMIESKMFTTNWVYLRSYQDDKDALLKLQTSDYPKLKSHLKKLSSNWIQKNYTDSLNQIYARFENLFEVERKIMGSLNDFSDYDDPLTKMESERLVEDIIIPHTTTLLTSLTNIITYNERFKHEKVIELERSTTLLSNMIFSLGITILLLGVFLALYMTKIITNPINKINDIIKGIAKGRIRQIGLMNKRDEIGKMIVSVNELSRDLEIKTSFAKEIGNRNFESGYSPLSEEDALGHALLTMRDNLRAGEKELFKTHLQMQTFFKNIDEVFFSVDMKEGRILLISPACERIYGYPESYFYKNPSTLLDVVVDDDKKLIDGHHNLMLEGKPFSQEYRINHVDGTIRWLETRVTPTLNGKTKLIRVDGVTSDITDRKAADEILKAYNTELQKTNLELDKFVYSVSHDLRAPLSSMLGIVEISEMETKEPMMIEHFHLLKGSIKKLDGFILDILDYSRNSRLDIKLEKINFKELLLDITNNLKYMGGVDRNVDVKININDEKAFISDKSRINIVLNNLISNAIRYQNPSVEKPFVDVNINMSDTETDIIVKDNGIGISKENQAKIFDMFYRVSENSVGSGLGLYLVKEVVEKLAGKIEIESEPGKGTSFIIHLPNNNNIN